MAYIEQSELTSEVPSQFILEALDDDSDGAADPGVWDAIAASVGQAIDAALGQRYEVPFVDPLPAIVKLAAKVFSASALYKRRGYTEEKNPWAKQEAILMKKLDAIGTGEEPLTPKAERKNPSASVISETAKTVPAGGGLIA